MKRDWTPDELDAHWTLSSDERRLLANKSGATRLSFAVLLKAFALEGRFPKRTIDVPAVIVEHLAPQVGVNKAVFLEVNWEGRSILYQRVKIRAHFGWRRTGKQDAVALAVWLSERVTTLDPKAESLKAVALERLRELKLEPPASKPFQLLLDSAVFRYESQLFELVLSRLKPTIRAALDELLRTNAGDPDQLISDPSNSDRTGSQKAIPVQASLFGPHSSFAQLKDDPGPASVETVLEEVRKLEQLRALKLPNDLFDNVPVRILEQLCKRAASGWARDLRRHPPGIRYTLIAVFCARRQLEITDTLVELLILIAHRINARAESKVETELVENLRKIHGKTNLLYALAETALTKPDGVIKDVLFPVIGEQVLKDLVAERKATGPAYTKRVQTVMRASYSHHYRRIIPALLNALEFRSNNDAHKPVIDALELLRKHMQSKSRSYPETEVVPTKGIVRSDWWAFVVETDHPTLPRVNRVNYEICVLQALREKLRCKEIWVLGAERYRNPDEDLPQDFESKRAEYYAQLEQPIQAKVFTTSVQAVMTTALEHLNRTMPDNDQVQIVTSKQGKGRFKVSPLEAQVNAPNGERLKSVLTTRWPMTSLLDILKESELRIGFCEAFRSLASRENLTRETLQRRLLLCLHGLGTNTGLKRVASGGGQDRYADLLHIRRRFIHPDQLRDAISRVVNATFEARQAHLWGEATTACASDSRKFGAYDQNLMTEWHARYGGPGVMIYWHVERHSVCIYSQLKGCASSEVAAMIEGVLRHDTSMDVERQYVDTHGQSEVAFAFTHLLGFKLLPRLKNIRKQKLYRPRTGEPDAYPNLKSVLSRPIDWLLIEQQYDEMIKLTTALRLGTANAESILRRFTRLNVQHPTYRALAELGKAVKTTFLCDYLRLESLRREIHEGLNVIETWNSANDFILYGKGGEFASNRLEDQEVAMLSLHLLQICLVFVNTLMIQRVLEDPAWDRVLTAEDLRALTPLLWAHVNPYGVFKLDMNERIVIEDQVLPLAAD